MRTLILAGYLAVTLFALSSLGTLAARIAITTANGVPATERDTVGIFIFILTAALFAALTIRTAKEN